MSVPVSSASLVGISSDPSFDITVTSDLPLAKAIDRASDILRACKFDLAHRDDTMAEFVSEPHVRYKANNPQGDLAALALLGHLSIESTPGGLRFRSDMRKLDQVRAGSIAKVVLLPLLAAAAGLTAAGYSGYAAVAAVPFVMFLLFPLYMRALIRVKAGQAFPQFVRLVTR